MIFFLLWTSSRVSCDYDAPDLNYTLFLTQSCEKIIWVRLKYIIYINYMYYFYDAFMFFIHY